MQAVAARVTRVAPELPVKDIAEALEYYTVRLGFTVAVVMPDRRYAIVERDGAAIHLFEDEDCTHTPVGLHLFTPQIDDLFEEFARRGAEVFQPIEQRPWGNREFRVRDTTGNVLKFTEPRE